MSPSGATENTSGITSCCSDNGGNLFVAVLSRIVKQADFMDLIGCQFRADNCGAPPHPSFLLRIGLIFSTRAKEEMVWVDADPIVAPMKDAQLSRVEPKESKRNAMRLDRTPRATLAQTDLAVAPIIKASEPLPAAGLRFDDLIEETLFDDGRIRGRMENGHADLSVKSRCAEWRWALPAPIAVLFYGVRPQ